MKYLFTLLAALILLFGNIPLTWAQDTLTFDNEMTEEHYHFLGSHLAMHIPEGFQISKFQPGLQSPEGTATIAVFRIPQQINKSIKNYELPKLEKTGIELRSMKNIRFEGMKGIWLKGFHDIRGAKFNKYTLTFGNNQFTTIISGSLPAKAAEATKEKMQKAMKTAVYIPNEDKALDQRLDYSIDPSIADLQLAYVNAANRVVYTEDGFLPGTQSYGTVFKSQFSPLKNAHKQDKKKFALQVFNNSIIVDRLAPKEVKRVEVNGNEGYEIYGYGFDAPGGEANNKKEEAKVLIAMTVVYTEEGYYKFIGKAYHRYAEHLKLFREVVQSLKEEQSG